MASWLPMTPHIDRNKLANLMAEEIASFARRNPQSKALSERSQSSLLGGVPMPWMTRWPGSFPVFSASASGAEVTDVDGNHYVDLCMGDTGAMVGHSLPAIVAALTQQASRGLTTMLPSEDAVWVGEELSRRFHLPSWQLAMTATDANRFVLRFARHLTGRQKILVFDYCYHGTVDETFAVLDNDGLTVPRPGSIGPAVAPNLTTVVVPFNDLDALRTAVQGGDIACVLAEPAMTNIGIILPQPGFWETARSIIRDAGTLLVIDETHTICVGPGGAAVPWKLDPDAVVIGKTIAGGIPAAAYGFTADVAGALSTTLHSDSIDISGVGGTLTANALTTAAIRATLENALRAEDFAIAIPLASAFVGGIQHTIERFQLPWHVQQLGCRAEYWFSPPPRNGREAHESSDLELDAFMHLWAANRGVLLTPFHNMALFSPQHSLADVTAHSNAFASAVEALLN
jgi:glutamate-1-semialdehyde 2,1-aminomutase